MVTMSLILVVLALAGLAALPPAPRVRHDREVRRNALDTLRLSRIRSCVPLD